VDECKPLAVGYPLTGTTLPSADETPTPAPSADQTLRKAGSEIATVGARAYTRPLFGST